MPYAAVRVLRAPYYRYLYDLELATPVLLSPEREAALAKAKQTSLARFTCRMCATYYASPHERQALVAQVCKHCQREEREWNRRVVWARELIQQEAVLLVEAERAEPAQPGQPIGCTVLDLASRTTRHTEERLGRTMPPPWSHCWINDRPQHLHGMARTSGRCAIGQRSSRANLSCSCAWSVWPGNSPTRAWASGLWRDPMRMALLSMIWRGTAQPMASKPGQRTWRRCVGWCCTWQSRRRWF